MPGSCSSSSSLSSWLLVLEEVEELEDEDAPLDELLEDEMCGRRVEEGELVTVCVVGALLVELE